MKLNKETVSYDVVVIGGGIAGLSAAVRAARLGVSVVLVEKYAFIGGMATAGLVSPFMKNKSGEVVLTNGVFEDLENTMRSMGGMIDNGFQATAFRAAAYKLLSVAGVSILFGAEVTEVIREGRQIKSIVAHTPDTFLSIEAKVFIDTSGDAQIAFLTDLPYMKGDDKSDRVQAMTLFFRMGGIDVEQIIKQVRANPKNFFDWVGTEFDLNKIVSIAGFFDEVKRAIKERKISEDLEYIFFTTLPASGEGSFNTSNVLGFDPTKSSDLTKAEFIGRQQVYEITRFMQQSIPGFENAYLIETGTQIGVRETRRIIGDYIMTGDDVRKAAKFEDACARGAYGVDIHGQKDEESTMEYLKEGEYYDIPLRAIIAKDADNLLAAGKCISSTREGHGAIRVMPISAATGEAAGALAALSIKENIDLRSVPYQSFYNVMKHNLS